MSTSTRTTTTRSAILIDPVARSVTALQLAVHDNAAMPHLQDLYTLLGTDELGHSRLPNGDSMWYDDNGLLKDWGAQAFCLAPFCETALAGRVVVTRYLPGIDEDELLDCRTDLALLQQAIQWIAPKAVEVPAPTVSSSRADGTMSEPVPVDGGAPVWTFADHPGKRVP